MGFYNVVRPCVVGQLHYARPTTEPIEVDDDVAAPLVEAGSLQPYRPGLEIDLLIVDEPYDDVAAPLVEDGSESPTLRRRSRRKSED